MSIFCSTRAGGGVLMICIRRLAICCKMNFPSRADSTFV